MRVKTKIINPAKNPLVSFTTKDGKRVSFKSKKTKRTQTRKVHKNISQPNKEVKPMATRKRRTTRRRRNPTAPVVYANRRRYSRRRRRNPETSFSKSGVMDTLVDGAIAGVSAVATTKLTQIFNIQGWMRYAAMFGITLGGGYILGTMNKRFGKTFVIGSMTALTVELLNQTLGGFLNRNTPRYSPMIMPKAPQTLKGDLGDYLPEEVAEMNGIYQLRGTSDEAMDGDVQVMTIPSEDLKGNDPIQDFINGDDELDGFPYHESAYNFYN